MRAVSSKVAAEGSPPTTAVAPEAADNNKTIALQAQQKRDVAGKYKTGGEEEKEGKEKEGKEQREKEGHEEDCLPLLFWWERVGIVLLLCSIVVAVGVKAAHHLREHSPQSLKPPKTDIGPLLSDAEVESVFRDWSDAVVSIELPLDSKDKRLAIASAGEDADVEKDIPSSARVRMAWQSFAGLKPMHDSPSIDPVFTTHVIFGIAASTPKEPYHDCESGSSEACQQHADDAMLSLRATMQEEVSFTATAVVPCSFHNRASSWQDRGLCFFFPLSEDQVTRRAKRTGHHQKQHHLSEEMWMLEQKVLRVLRRRHQPCMFKWWPHRWGTDPAHVTVMQSLVPARPDFERLKLHGPMRSLL